MQVITFSAELMNALCPGPWQEQVVIEEVKMDLKGMEQVTDPSYSVCRRNTVETRFS